MSEKQSEKQPTIENPFKGTKLAPKSILATMQERKAEREAKAAEAQYDPGYYTSLVSKKYLKEQIATTTIVEKELPTIHELALIIGNLFNRQTPTISDFQYAVQFRSWETVREVAQNEKQLDIAIKGETQEMMPKRERIQLWQRVAELSLEEYEKRHTKTNSE